MAPPSAGDAQAGKSKIEVLESWFLLRAGRGGFVQASLLGS